MIKGAQKQMIVVKTGESRWFDEAYFVLRRDVAQKEQDPGLLLQEANRILEECTHRRHKKQLHLLPRVLFFLSGVAMGTGLSALLFFIFL